MTSALLAACLAAAPVELQTGTLTLAVSTSETAQCFHIVDQLSKWSPYSHGQYRKHLATRTAGTERETFNEGLAYAVMPGLWRLTAQRDPLADLVAADAKAGKHLDDNYTRFRRLALALRPTLKDALDKGQTLEDVLPLEAALFRGLREVDEAALPAATFCFGKPCTKPLMQRIAEHAEGNVWGRPLAQMASVTDKIRPRDTVVLFPEGELPVEAQRLCGDAWPKLSPRLAADAGFEQVGNVTVAWGASGLERAAVMLGLDGGF